MGGAKKTLSQKIQELDDMVEWFYSDEFSLNEVTEKYKSSIELAKEIKKDLTELKNEIKILSEDFSK